MSSLVPKNVGVKGQFPYPNWFILKAQETMH